MLTAPAGFGLRAPCVADATRTATSAPMLRGVSSPEVEAGGVTANRDRARWARWLRDHVHLAVGFSVMLAVAIVRVPIDHGESWFFFDRAARSLFGRDQLHVFARHPSWQFGPIAVIAAEAFKLLGRAHTVLLVELVLVASVMGIVVMLDRFGDALGTEEHTRRVCIALGAVLLVPAWDDIAVRNAHLDDAIALVASLAAFLAVARRRPMLAALALSVAIGAKPWAALFTPVLFALPRRGRAKAVAAACATTALFWLPFVLADTRTLDAARFTIVNAPTSALRRLGFRNARTPRWDRLAQFVVGVACGTVAVARRRWAAVLLAGVGVRLLLDPATHRYYTAGLLLAALVVDIAYIRRRIPWTTAVAFVLVYLPNLLDEQTLPILQGSLRLFATLTAVVFAFTVPLSRTAARTR
jgi:hypothetical protein